MGWSWFHSPWSWFFGWKNPTYHPPNRIHPSYPSPNLSLPSYHAWLPGELGKRLVKYFACENWDCRNPSEIQSIKQKLPNLNFQLKKLRALWRLWWKCVCVCFHYFLYPKTNVCVYIYICKILWNTALVPSKNWGKHVLPASQLSPSYPTCGSRSSKRSSSCQQSKDGGSIRSSVPNGFGKKQTGYGCFRK